MREARFLNSCVKHSSKVQMEKLLKITKCLSCPDHRVIDDGDPYDSFCRDDLALVCIKVKNPTQNVKSVWMSERQEFKVVTCSCRPYNLEKESNIPDWCPLD